MKLRVGSVCLLTAFAIAAQASSALAAAVDPRPAPEEHVRHPREDDHYRRGEDPRGYERRAVRDRERYADEYYRDRERGRYPYTDDYYNDPQPEPYCGAHKGRRAPAIMTYDQTTGTQVLVDNNSRGVAVTGRNDGAGSAFAVDGDLSKPNVPYMCAADDQSGDSYVIDPNDRYGDEGDDYAYDATVRGIDADTGRRWEVANGDGRGPAFETYDPRTGCISSMRQDARGRPDTDSGLNYGDYYRRSTSDFFAGGAAALGGAAAGLALAESTAAAPVVGAALIVAGVAAATAPC